MNLFNVYPLYEVTPSKAKDIFVFDENQNKYLDLYGGHAVISIGHGNKYYVKSIVDQINKIGFYSNAIKNPLQNELAIKLANASNCNTYSLFMCSSGAEANENAIKLASFYNNKSRIISFKYAFHGRTSAAVAVTDNPNIVAPINSQQKVTFLPFNEIDKVKIELEKNDVSSVIFESIQGVGGLDQPNDEFINNLSKLCKKYDGCLIADEVQSGFGRSGDFFGFQKFKIEPDIITLAKGMGNGFPVGGVLINRKIKPKYGMLGTTYGGNHLACAASLSVLHQIKENNLMENAKVVGDYFINEAKKIDKIKNVKGRGLMLGLEFEFEVAELRKKLIYDHKIFTGGSSNKKLIRILPPLTIKKEHIDIFFKALKIELKKH